MHSENKINNSGVSLQEIFEYLRDNLRLDTKECGDHYSSWTEVKLYLKNPETDKEEIISDITIFQ